MMNLLPFLFLGLSMIMSSNNVVVGQNDLPAWCSNIPDDAKQYNPACGGDPTSSPWCQTFSDECKPGYCGGTTQTVTGKDWCENCLDEEARKWNYACNGGNWGNWNAANWANYDWSSYCKNADPWTKQYDPNCKSLAEASSAAATKGVVIVLILGILSVVAVSF